MGATYTFKTRSDDSSIVMVNGKEVVNNRNLHGMQSREGSVKLDKPVAIDIYFGEKGGGAGLKFEWKGGSQASFTDRLVLFTPSKIGGPGCFGDCYLCYCNAHPDLQNAFCGGGRCTEANAPACKSHWEAWGQKEGWSHICHTIVKRLRYWPGKQALDFPSQRKWHPAQYHRKPQCHYEQVKEVRVVML